MSKTTIFEQIDKNLNLIKNQEKKNLDLKKFEKIEIESRGFYVRRNHKNNYIYSVLFFLLAGYIITSLLGFFSWMILSLIIMSISFEFFEKIEMMLMYLPHLLLFFLIFARLMVATVFGQNEYYFSKSNKPVKRFYNNWNSFKWSLIGISKPLKENTWLYLVTILILLVVIYGLSLIVHEFIGFYGVLVYLIVPLISLLLFYPLKLVGVTILENLHPLYAFGNLGEKIQSLTPQIEEKSQEIQKNFQSDMNFRVLSDGFDSLSKTFSQVISLVIKLEGVEKRANKGNLFDSEKYINSIKGDIIEPLKSLRSFLEAKRVELELSQKELQKVRVGGSDELNFQSGLASKRSESLLRELVENMNKLDSMIQKMSH